MTSWCPTATQVEFCFPRLWHHYRPKGEGNVFTGVCLSTIALMATRSRLGLVMARSVRILLECFLVFNINGIAMFFRRFCETKDVDFTVELSFFQCQSTLNKHNLCLITILKPKPNQGQFCNITVCFIYLDQLYVFVSKSRLKKNISFSQYFYSTDIKIRSRTVLVLKCFPMWLSEKPDPLANHDEIEAKPILSRNVFSERINNASHSSQSKRKIRLNVISIGTI